MSAELYYASEPSGNNASPQGTTLGGSKPLHRFIKGQPKIIGIIVLVLGTSFFITSIGSMAEYPYYLLSTLPGFLLGTMFIICGILYILTEHNPTKKTVTISLAMSVVTTLGACWTLLQMVPNIVDHHYYREYEITEYNDTEHIETYGPSQDIMIMSMELILLLYIAMGAVILIVMSSLAGAALRSTKSQAIVMMSTTPAETPVE